MRVFSVGGIYLVTPEAITPNQRSGRRLDLSQLEGHTGDGRPMRARRQNLTLQRLAVAALSSAALSPCGVRLGDTCDRAKRFATSLPMKVTLINRLVDQSDK